MPRLSFTACTIRCHRSPDHRHRMKNRDRPAKRYDSQHNIQNQHDQRPRHRAVQHAKRTEKEGQHQRKHHTLLFRHHHSDAHGHGLGWSSDRRPYRPSDVPASLISGRFSLGPVDTGKLPITPFPRHSLRLKSDFRFRSPQETGWGVASSVSASPTWQQGICRVAPRVLCEVAYMRGKVITSSDSRETHRLRLG
jgi:hypothetical protein